MDDESVSSQFGMHIIRGCLIVSIQAELYDDVVCQLQEDILKRVHQSGVKGVILDVSTVEIMDSFIAKSFADTARMTAVLGAQTVLVGIKPVVAIALTDLDISLTDLRTALTPEQALQMLEPFIWPGDNEVVAETPATDDGDGSVD